MKQIILQQKTMKKFLKKSWPLIKVLIIILFALSLAAVIGIGAALWSNSN